MGEIESFNVRNESTTRFYFFILNVQNFITFLYNSPHFFLRSIRSFSKMRTRYIFATRGKEKDEEKERK